jgi:arsenate reductase
VIEIVEASGYVPTVINYLDTGWTRPQLLALFAAAGLTPRAALRISKTPAIEMGLTEERVSADEILNAMIAHPILVNRPLVATPKGVRLCRPSETVLDLLERMPAGPFFKEDGEMIIDSDGKRVA